MSGRHLWKVASMAARPSARLATSPSSFLSPFATPQMRVMPTLSILSRRYFSENVDVSVDPTSSTSIKMESEEAPVEIRDNRGGKNSMQKSSKYRGVSRQGDLWKAQLYGNGIVYYIGRFRTEEEAARAYDKKAVEIHGSQARVNFDADGNFIKLISSKKRSYATKSDAMSLKTSKYLGVSYVNNRWLAKLCHLGKIYYLGTFKTEIEAAKAFDKKKIELVGHGAKTNFDEMGNSFHYVTVAKPKEVIDKKSTKFKLSRFRGVSWSNHSEKKWTAHIRKNGKLYDLGRYYNEEDAAKAYDAKARELNGADAKPNFDENGKEIEYKIEIEYYARVRSSRYRGVYLDSRRRNNVWKAVLTHERKNHFLGYFETEEEAARAYDRKAIEVRKHEAVTNFKIEDYAQTEDVVEPVTMTL